MGVGDELSERKKLILKALVDAHIECGEPVGSKYLMSFCDIGCSSATIRNEMSELEEMGYLEQPHTSAGRVPSQAGYRFYVDALMQAYSLTQKELAELANMQRARMSELDKIIKTAGRLIASMTNYTTVSVKTRPQSQTVTCFTTSLIDKRNFILSMIMNDEEVKSKYIHVPFDISDETLNRLCGVLNNNITRKTSDEITLPVIMKMESEMGEYDVMISPIIKSIYEVTSKQEDGELEFEGMDKLLEYPEFADVTKLRELLTMLDNKSELISLVEKSEDDSISIYIGGENGDTVYKNSSMILKPLRARGKVVGAIGVIGPRRMEYPKVVAMIEYIADCITTIIDSETKKELKEPDGKQEGDNDDGS